jgi:hypothetical protein
VKRPLGALALGLLLASASHAVPFWGARSSEPADTDPAKLRPGQFIWEGAAQTSGPIVVVVSLTEQRAYVYRNGVRIGVSTASTGKPGHRTPTGVFHVLQKDKDHHSKTYHDAAMPDTERLTWDGVALHAGGLPGYPSSHGCVHLPSEFARLLFEISSLGMTVVIADTHEAPQDVVHPAALAPVAAATGREDAETPLAAGEELRWEPEKSPEGPVSIVMSGADRRVFVLRNGVEIGRARLALDEPERPLGTHAFLMLEGAGRGQSPLAPGEPARRWIAVGIPGHAGEAKESLDPAQVSRLHLPPAFARDLYAILAPGTTLLVTDAPILEQTTGVSTQVVDSDPPPES